MNWSYLEKDYVFTKNFMLFMNENGCLINDAGMMHVKKRCHGCYNESLKYYHYCYPCLIVLNCKKRRRRKCLKSELCELCNAHEIAYFMNVFDPQEHEYNCMWTLQKERSLQEYKHLFYTKNVKE
jgi:hypothetical protein